MPIRRNDHFSPGDAPHSCRDHVICNGRRLFRLPREDTSSEFIRCAIIYKFFYSSLVKSNAINKGSLHRAYPRLDEMEFLEQRSSILLEEKRHREIIRRTNFRVNFRGLF